MKIKKTVLLLIIFVLAAAVRLSYGLYTYSKEGSSKFVDDWKYMNYARNINSQGIFVLNLQELNRAILLGDRPVGYNSSIVGPGYPLILAICFSIFGEAFIPVIILNALVSALLCVLIYFLGLELFDERTAIMAACWSIFYYLFIAFTPRLMKENWMAFLFPLVIFLFLKESKRKEISYPFLGFFSLLYVFLIHTDERFFTYFPLLLLGFVFLDRISWQKGIQKSAVFCLLVLILMVPWFLRNLRVYHRPIILTERTARFTDKIFGYDEQVADHQKKQAERLRKEEEAARLIAAGEAVPFKVPQLEALKTAFSLGYIPHTFSRLERAYADFEEFWRPFRFSGGFTGNGYRFEGSSWPLSQNLSIGLTYGVLLPFFLVSFYFILKNRDRYGIFILLVIFVHTVIHVVMAFARNRYRIPVDPFIIILAFYAVQQLYHKLAKGDKLAAVPQIEKKKEQSSGLR